MGPQTGVDTMIPSVVTMGAPGLHQSTHEDGAEHTI